MPSTLNPLITNAGLAAAIAADADGLQLQITHVALGASRYTPDVSQTALVNRKEKATISAGTVTAIGGFRISVLFPSWTGAPNPYNAREIGFYAGDPDAGGILFAVYSDPDLDTFIVQRNALDYMASFALQLSRVPDGSVTVVVDASGAQSLALWAAHEAEANPHPQYMQGRLLGVRVFSAVGSTTYVPSVGTSSIIVEVQGGGGAGGGSAACGVGESNAGPGGGGGGYAKSRLTSGFSGAVIEVGAGGVGSVGGDGSNGTQSSFGSIVAPGGSGGDAPPVSYSLFPAVYGYGFAGATGINGNIFNSSGQPGLFGVTTSPIYGISGGGGASKFGGGGDAITSGQSDGRHAVSFGAGGSGAMSIESGAAQAGGSGKSGVVVVYEYS